MGLPQVKMAVRLQKNVIVEVLTRLFLFVCFLILEYLEPVQREILENEMWQYSHKMSANSVSVPLLFTLSIALPLLVIVLWSSSKQDVEDLICGLLAFSLAMGVNGVLTSTLKIAVGRPRPDFLWRCFPNGQITPDLKCTGNYNDVIEGRKSFPSGHASWMFTSCSFTSLYLAGKLSVFSARGIGQSPRLLVVLAPSLVSLLVGVSRIRDKWHHWDDVAVGSLIGILCALLCYHQFYPVLWAMDCDVPRMQSTSLLQKMGYGGITKRSVSLGSINDPEALQTIIETKDH